MPAISEFTTAIELKPELANVYANRAAAYYYKRDYQAAWADVKACRKLGGEIDPEFLAGLRKASGRDE